MLTKKIIALALFSAAAVAQAQVVQEGFENVANLGAKGFILLNNSSPVGTTGFGQGGGSFSAQAGSDQSYISGNFNNAGAGGFISNYLITPEFSTTNFGTISFYARADVDAGYVDLLSYGLSNGGFAPGDFTLTPEVAASTDEWQRYSLSFLGTGANTTGRFAIRYSGQADTANLIGIDSLSVQLPEPGTSLMLGVGLVGLLAARRRKKA
jgi:hypothetical protein